MAEKKRLNALISKHEEVVLFGASVAGRECLEQINGENKKRIWGFTDNFSHKKEYLDFPLFPVADAISSNAKILITSRFWADIYKQLLDMVDYERVIGVFLGGYLLDISCLSGGGVNKDELFERVITMGKDQFTGVYKNYAHIKLDQIVNEEIKKKVGLIKDTRDWCGNLWEVNIELSNLCNYSMMHPKCPTSKFKEKRILPSKTVYQLLDELSEMNYKGIIRFGSYNEVLIDPRLFMFIDYVKKHVKCAHIFLYSNGFYLNDTMARELSDAGVDELTVTAYGDREYERLRDLNIDIAYKILMCKTPMHLDDRLELYERAYRPNLTPCIEAMMFRVDAAGHLRLCCLDWRGAEYLELGEISDHSIKEWTNSERVLNNVTELAKGNRICDMCKRCDWHNVLDEI